MMNDKRILEEEIDRIRKDITDIEAEMSRVIVGQKKVLRHILTALFADGHVLLEGLPGLGKTLMVKTLRDIINLQYSRVQFTPDLMPADITGTNIIDFPSAGGKSFSFEPGPIFTNLLLADEINRASPKTQSALLQAMQEKEVTIFGKHYKLEEPFCTIATQNPIEMAGTYPLPEAQLDRFLFKIIINPPTPEELVEIADRTTGPEVSVPEKIIDKTRLLEIRRTIVRMPVAGAVMRMAAGLVTATHPEMEGSPGLTRKYVRYGASPRGLQAIVSTAKVSAVWDGRFHVSTGDILENLLPALRHRIIFNFEGELQKVDMDEYLLELAREMSTV